MDNIILKTFISDGNSLYSSAGILYHYTSVEVFRKILENRELWISNANFMNDEQEIMNGIGLCRKVLGQKRAVCDPCYDAYYRRLLESCDRRESSGPFNIHSENIFAMSFCSSGDILTQWQEYANGGISIGFRNAPADSRERIMLKGAGGAVTDLNPISVIYNDAEKERVLSDLIDIGIRLIGRSDSENIREIIEESVSDSLYQFFPAMKNRNFAHEKESRFICCVEDSEREAVEFREKHGIILPYIRMLITDPDGNPHPVFPIEDIVISPGPRIDYVEKSVRYFLRMSGYGYLEQKVRKSDIPYRV